jgi:low affinity Fe/Cu permease
MNERTRLIIHTIGVIVVFTIIIFMRLLFYYQGNIIGFLKSEFIFYAIGIAAILIFTQFLISTTYSSKHAGSSSSEMGDSENQKKLQYELQKVRQKSSELKKKIKSLKDENRKIERKSTKVSEDLEKLKIKILSSIVSDRSLLKDEFAVKYPFIHVSENYFFNSLDHLKEVNSQGIDSYQLESSVAFISSFQLYNMLNYIIKEVDEYSGKQIEQLLEEYASILNNSLKYVEVINYGYINVYEDSSHRPIGFVDEYDEVYPKSFKVSSRDTGGIIYKALVRKA